MYATELLGSDNMTAIKNKVNTNLTKVAARVCHTNFVWQLSPLGDFSQIACARSVRYDLRAARSSPITKRQEF